MSATPKTPDAAAIARTLSTTSARPPGRGVLVVTPSRCTACRTCELACAVAHGEHMRPARSRIRAYSFGENKNVPVLCLQCEDAACARVCPVEAITFDERIAALRVDTTVCVMCMVCVPACPFGNIAEDPTTSTIVKCDLCGGNPICAQFCPTGALVFEPA